MEPNGPQGAFYSRNVFFFLSRLQHSTGMGVYRYQAIDPLESLVRGTVTADSIHQARRQLRDQGLVVRRIREHQQVSMRGMLPPLLSGTGRQAKQWERSIDELAMLLQAGVPLLEALETLAQQVQGAFRTTLESVRDKVGNGSSLASALREYPGVFDLVSVQLVEVGENTGELDVVLRELAEFKQQSSQFKDKVATILIYPAFLCVLGIAAAIFLMTQVMPPLLESLQETMPELPAPTRIVQGFSQFLISWGWLVGLLVIVAAVVAVILLRIRSIRLQFDLLWLRTPVLGNMALKQSLARVAMVISVLSRSGIPLTRAFELAAQTCRNTGIRDALHRCSTLVAEGKSIPEALRHSPVFPPIVLQIFSIGEESGRLEELLTKLSTDYTRQVGQRSARIAALLEPILIIVLATFIGFLMLSIILPILEAGNVVS